MTVRELIEELSKVDPDRIVVLQIDPEGNGYNPADGVDDNCGYKDGEVKKEHLRTADRKAGFTDEDLCDPDAKPCVVLYP